MSAPENNLSGLSPETGSDGGKRQSSSINYLNGSRKLSDDARYSQNDVIHEVLQMMMMMMISFVVA